MKTNKLNKLSLRKDIVVLLNDSQSNLNGGGVITTKGDQNDSFGSKCKFCPGLADAIIIKK